MSTEHPTPGQMINGPTTAARIEMDAEFLKNGAEIRNGQIVVPEEHVEWARNRMEKELEAHAPQAAMDVLGPLDHHDADRARGSLEVEPVDPETREVVKGIVGLIQDSVVFGKFVEGTHFKTGLLPERRPNFRHGEDYSFHPHDSVISVSLGSFSGNPIRALGTYLRQDRHHPDFSFSEEISRARNLGGGETADENHYFMRIPLGDGRVLVNYLFLDTFKDFTGRDAGYTDCLFLMPEDAGQSLEDLIRVNPDAAEEFFRQAMQGFEKPKGAPEQAPGVTRFRSSGINIINCTSELYSALGQKSIDWGQVHNAMKAATTTLKYSDGRQYGHG